MSSIPLFYRKGSLLAPADTGPHLGPAPVAPGEAVCKPKRKGYSLHHILSPSIGQALVRTRLHDALLAWADTEPGVRDVALVDQSISYQDAGRTKTTRMAYETAARMPPVQQQVWVLAGRIEVSVGDEHHLLDVGDCLALQLDRPVVFRNPARRPARYAVVLFAPGVGP